MPDNKRIQGPEESQSPHLFLKSDEREKKSLLGDDGLRKDGRRAEEMRPIYIKTGVNSRASGSAYVELGNTKAICTIYGPKETPRKDDYEPNGKLTCDFKFAPFSCLQRRQYQKDQEEKDLTALITNALRRAVRLETLPKLQLELNVLILENAGNALGAALLAASTALASCGVEMVDIPIASAGVQYESTLLVDPSFEEEQFKDLEHKAGGSKGESKSVGWLLVVYLPSLDEVTSLRQRGQMEQDELMKAIDTCIESCLRIKQLMRDILTS